MDDAQLARFLGLNVSEEHPATPSAVNTVLSKTMDFRRVKDDHVVVDGQLKTIKRGHFEIPVKGQS